MKTKPTQHCVERLRQIGIQPDILICRTERADLAKDDIDKIALFCNVEPRPSSRKKTRNSASTRCLSASSSIDSTS